MILPSLSRDELLRLLVSELLPIRRDEFMFTHIIFIIKLQPHPHSTSRFPSAFSDGL
jgi:hypothetical protein